MADAYDFIEFIRDCSAGKAQVTGKALSTARLDFGLTTQRDVLSFIGSGGLERPVAANLAAPLEKNPFLPIEITVDSYDFFSGVKYGYLAYWRRPDGLWVIKSFKENDKTNPRFFTLGEALRKAGLS